MATVEEPKQTGSKPFIDNLPVHGLDIVSRTSA